jgi:FkbM family methyltransferase
MRRNLIFDLGLHKGEDSEFYLKKGFSVVAVEADPQLAAQATDRLRAYVEAGQLTIVAKAIAGREGPVTFYRSENITIWGTIEPTWAERNRHLGATIRVIEVPGICFAQLVSEYGTPYYMKIDIEGADMLCLEGLVELTDRPKFVSIESSKTSFEDLVKEFCLFQQLGYRKYKVVPQHRIGEQELPTPPREGKYVNHKFREGCSGAFGLELPGDWIDLEAALKEYVAIFKKYRVTGDRGAISNTRLVRGVLRSGRSGQRSPLTAMAKKVIHRVGSSLRLRPGWYDTHAMRDD